MKNNYSYKAAIAVNKSLLKEYQTKSGRTVYLDADTEFQIKLFNPYDYTIGAEIYLNGKSLGETLIIKPGQMVWLERYFNEARKFKFDVYEVDAYSEAVRQAIRNNGDIEIKFYKERVPVQPTIWSSDIPYNVYNSNATTNVILSPSYSNDIPMATMDGCGFSYSASLNTTMETGRVEKGGYSGQRFITVNMEFEYIPFSTEKIKILPKSQKPVYKEDLEKVYCTECGRKIKPKFKYCPFCGTKQ